LSQSGQSAKAKELTNKDMERIRAIRESTCIHGCYYVDTPKECSPPEENGIPNCKREIELILEAASQEQGQEDSDSPRSGQDNRKRLSQVERIGRVRLAVLVGAMLIGLASLALDVDWATHLFVLLLIGIGVLVFYQGVDEEELIGVVERDA
jgi:hypothetical protein